MNLLVCAAVAAALFAVVIAMRRRSANVREPESDVRPKTIGIATNAEHHVVGDFYLKRSESIERLTDDLLLQWKTNPHDGIVFAVARCACGFSPIPLSFVAYDVGSVALQATSLEVMSACFTAAAAENIQRYYPHFAAHISSGVAAA